MIKLRFTHPGYDSPFSPRPFLDAGPFKFLTPLLLLLTLSAESPFTMLPSSSFKLRLFLAFVAIIYSDFSDVRFLLNASESERIK